MNATLGPFFVLGLVMVAVVAGLALWRRTVAREEDDTLHVLADSSTIAHQAGVAHRLEAIDKWGKLLTIVTAIYLLLVVAGYFYQQWVHGSALDR